ncbi:MAG: cellulose biosynthesis cyclic di-GMP-binding regulatory protein BcsB [Candidatus Caldatribacterium sp.]|nr:cellulose biosynthesis cyclic di-GMP-binding regulatory protein BcsB [Candidatus Caldatribacterium sp.]
MKRLAVFLLVLLGFFLSSLSEGKEWTLGEIAGTSQDIVLEGPSPSFTLYLPLFPGMRLESGVLLLEYVASPVLARGSTLSVYGGDTLLASFEIQPGERRIRIPLFPLKGKPLGDILPLEIRGNLWRSENLCEDLLSRELFVRIRPESRLLVEFDEAISTVRDFFRFPSPRIRIFLPEDFSSKELLEGYLKLFAFLRRRGKEVTTEILPQRIPEATEGELRIVFREKALRDVELLGSTLYLTPQGVQGVLAELSLFVDRSFGVRSFPLFWGAKRTLRDFGVRSTTLRGIGELRKTVYFTLADLGGVPDSLYFVLLFSSTPLPEVPKGEAFLKVFLNGNLVFTRKIPKAAKRGIERESIFLPPRLLGRENALDIVFSYFPEVGECRRGTMPLEVTIFEQSYLSGNLRGIPNQITFADAPTVFSGKAWVILPEKPSLEELEVIARLYGALREIDDTPLVLEVVHELPERRRDFPSFSLASLLNALKEKGPWLLFAPPPLLNEYFLVFDREGEFLSAIPALRKDGILALSPLPHLETLTFSPDSPSGVLVAQKILGKPALVFTPLGREDVACSAFLAHFRGAETLRTMEGNVALFTLRGWGETRVVVRPSFGEISPEWRLLLFAASCVALALWCLVLYRKLVRLKRP